VSYLSLTVIFVLVADRYLKEILNHWRDFLGQIGLIRE